MGKMQQFKREIRSSNGRIFAFDLRNGFGAALGGLFERIARGKVYDKEIREIYGFDEDDGPSPQRVRISAGPQMTPSAKAGKYTALVSLHGVALYDLEYQPYCFSTLLLSQIMESLANDPSVDTIVLDINTPGGHVTGTQEAADAVYKAARRKQVIGIINPLCASAGYWIGSQCTKLIAVPSADVGSIGVFMCHYDCSAMLADAGVKPTFIFAGEYKTEGNSLEPLSADALQFYQSEVNQTYDDFLTAVARGRGLTKDIVLEKFGKGRCYGAPMAKRIGMVDEIATIKLALQSVGLTMEMPEEGGRRRRGDEQSPDESADAGEQQYKIVGEVDGVTGGIVVSGMNIRSISSDDPPSAGEINEQDVTAQVVPHDDCETFTIRQDVDGDQVKFYALGPWPAKSVFCPETFKAQSRCVTEIGGTITIAVENGAAVYSKVGITQDGDWVCHLAGGSSWTAPPDSPEEAASKAEAKRAAEANARRRRLAVLSA
jgi:signal peptide peptidase SppA